MMRMRWIAVMCVSLCLLGKPCPAIEGVPGQKNGVPLGGVGTGAVELLPDGSFANITVNNNRSAKQRIEFSRGAFFAIRTEVNKRVESRILATRSALFLGKIDKPQTVLLKSTGIRYEGLYPKAALEIRDTSLPVKTTLAAFGPVVYHDLPASSMPAAIFVFTIANPNKVAVTASLGFSWENLNGMAGDFPQQDRSRVWPIESGGKFEGVLFGHRGVHRESYWGRYAVAADCPGSLSAAQWAPQSPESTATMWKDFSSDGRMDGDLSSQTGNFAAMTACRVDIPPLSSREVAFVLAWYFPLYIGGETDMGNHYTNLWPDAETVARKALAARASILERINAFHDRFLHSNLPDYLSDMLINNLYVLTTNTLHTKDGRFSIMETPAGPMMGTLDQRFYGSIATLMLFPGLEITEMNLFADTQHPQDAGRIYHDLGTARLDQPSTGTTDKNWTDLNPKFVLMAWRDYVWTGDRAFLERLYPKLKQVMAYTLSQDAFGLGLPDQRGRSTTYDDWAFFGVNSYASSLWIASIEAYTRIALALGDIEEAEKYKAIFTTAKFNFEKMLWNNPGGYYRLYNDPGAKPEMDHPAVNDGSHDGQLAGQWYAEFLHLGRIVPQNHIDRAIQHMHLLNEKSFGVAKGLMPDGSPVANPTSENWWSESENGWPHYETCHYAALAADNGRLDIALGVAEKQYKNIHSLYRLTWNQPLRWDLAKNGTYGWGADRYMTSPSIWHLLYSIEGFALDIPGETLWLQPMLPEGSDDLIAPLVTPGAFGSLEFHESGHKSNYQQRVSLKFDAPISVRVLILRVPRRVLNVSAAVSAKGGKPEIVNTEVAPDAKFNIVRVTFKKAVNVGAAGLEARLREKSK